MNKNDLKTRNEMTRKAFNIRKPEDWLAVLKSIRGILAGADPEERCQMGVAIVEIGKTINLPDHQLLEFFDVSRADLEMAVPVQYLKDRGVFACLMLSPQLSPTCRQFFEAWTSTLEKT